MGKIRCVSVIPAESKVNPALGLNVLVLAINGGEEQDTAQVKLFGAADREIRPLVNKTCVLDAKEHAHLYFHIPADCFAPDFWDGEAPEEMTLYAGTDKPETKGNLIFI